MACPVIMVLTRPCPLCACRTADSLLAFTPAWFDTPEPLSPTRIVSCDRCGFVFCDTQQEGAFYTSYYNDRAQNNPGTGLGSGRDSRWDEEHYQRVHDLLAEAVLPDARLVDVGCGRGGFLRYLRDRDFCNLRGVDLDKGNVEYLSSVERIACTASSAAAFPCRDVDVLVYNFIFEHLFDIREVVRHAWQSLVPGGLVFVEVPDVMAFASYPIFPFFHFALFEHLNYFSDDTLTRTFADEGFETVQTGANVYHMAEHVLNPMVWGIFRKAESGKRLTPAKSESRKGAEAYVAQSHDNLLEAHSSIAELASNRQPVFVWGACVELFALISHTDLLTCNIQSIIDNNPEKQTKTVRGIPIEGSHVLANATSDAMVLIVSTIHATNMLAELDAIGYRGKVLDISQCALRPPHSEQ